jgi:hypothetical protein
MHERKAMNAVVEMPRAGIVPQSAGRMSVAEVVQHAMVVQEVMQAVMKPDLHYGRIPGTDKPTLYKAGAEKLCMVFRIDDDYEIEDLSTADSIRYRVKCIGSHQVSQMRLGSGVGECSVGEEKYKWRKAVCDEEFDETPLTHRRVKYAKAKGGGHYKQKQVRTEPSDLANTVLKMASKRAKIAMVLNVLAVSDMFGQDLEDLDGVLQEHLTGENSEQQGQASAQAPAQQPAAWPDDKLNERETKCKEWAAAGKTADDAINFFASKGTMTEAQKARVRSWMTPPQAAPVPSEPTDTPAADGADDLPWKD